MRIEAFRITNFRSIVDSRWFYLSRDDVTVIIGQNESGKSSVLDAIWKTFCTQALDEEEVRFDSPLPKTYVRVSLNASELEQELKDYSDSQKGAFQAYLATHDGRVDVAFGWTVEPGEYKGTFDIEDQELASILAAAAPTVRATEDDDEDTNDAPKLLTSETIAKAIYNAGPEIVQFKQGEGLLPNSIEVRADGTLNGDGKLAAENYLTVAGISLKTVISAELRAQQNYLERANAKISQEFNSFWTQYIGRRMPLKLECRLEHYKAGSVAQTKVGQPYLTFWISNGLTRLYPGQRSAGVRWFVSFYLQLMATERSGKKRIFLLDEPGANLHSRAQEDVLRLIDKLKESIPIVYSTHSQDMIEFDKLYRVRAVQRSTESEEGETEIFEAERLGAASSDTLTPVLNAIGTSLHKQQVIPKRGNLILEEPSARYYLDGFLKLTGRKDVVYFLAATGANKVTQLALMFQGWGIEFGVLLDDDSRGRSVFNELKRDLYGDRDDVAGSHLLKVKGCNGIEDMFSRRDFHAYVAKDFACESGEDPSAWAKAGGRSKPLLAYQFWEKVKSGGVTIEQLEPETRQKIEELMQRIVLLDAIKQRQ